MSQLLTLRAAMVSQIKTLVGSGWDVQPHLGRFSDEELKLFMATAPAVRVSSLKIGQPTEIPDMSAGDYPCTLGVYVVTKDGATRYSRDEQAIAAVEAIILLSDRNRWGCGAFVRNTKPKGASNLYSDKGLRDGVALWAIELEATVRLAPPDPETYAATAMYYSQAPNIGPAHVDDYTQATSASQGAPS